MKRTGLQEEFRERAEAAKRFLFLLDFDGTLSAIVRDPADARLGAGHRSTLRRLARRRDVSIVILSGRTGSDLARRVPIRGIVLRGEHGLEGSDSRLRVPASWPRTLRFLLKEMGPLVSREEGAWLERKSLSFTVHFREVKAGRQRAFCSRILAALKRLSLGKSSRVRTGKKIVEVLPPVAWGKGEIAARIAKKAGPGTLVLAIGDDETDEEMFRALPAALTIRVGRGKTSARFRLAGPSAVAGFLSWTERAITPDSIR